MVILVGIAWRSLRYLLQFPIWGDEAFVALNLLDRDYVALTRPLRFVQVVPILFLWVELAAYHLLGGSELALRLFPFLAGLGALALFWPFVRSSPSPLGGGLALGILAVVSYPVRHSRKITPYAFDLLASLALLVTAASWLREPNRLPCPWELTRKSVALNYYSGGRPAEERSASHGTMWQERPAVGGHNAWAAALRGIA
jgi:hypothetical protein